MCNGYGDFKIEYFQLSGQFGMIKSQKCMQYNHHSVVGREYNYNWPSDKSDSILLLLAFGTGDNLKAFWDILYIYTHSCVIYYFLVPSIEDVLYSDKKSFMISRFVLRSLF